MIGLAARWSAAALGRTWRIETAGETHLRTLREAREPFVFALWHGDLLPLLWHHRGRPTTLITSAHRDGRYLANAAVRWGYRVVEGSSRRGGAAALRGAVRALRDGGEVAIAVDGPTGPRHVVKPGIVVAARLAGVSILPVVAVSSSEWRVRSWDAFRIPHPFARVRIAYGEPVAPPDARRERGQGVREVEDRLRRIRREVAA